MQNFNGAIVVKIVDSSGKRLGASIRRNGIEVTYFKNKDMIELVYFLKNNQQKLENAVIASDGRIIPKKNKVVKEEESSVTKLQDKTGKSDEVYIYTLAEYASKCTIYSNDKWFSKVRIEEEFFSRGLNKAG